LATLIPSLGASTKNMTPGERRFAGRLIEKLEDDYLCWFDVPIGPRSMHPDFVVLNPRRGLLIVEVKDWRRETIHTADRASVTILTGTGQRVVPNPLEQARQYAHSVCNLLEKDPHLIRGEGDRHQNRLCFPYGYGVVLANIDRSTFQGSGLDQVIDPDRVICKDEMYESVEPEEFQQRLWNMFTVNFTTVLSLPQIDRIRWHLFPEVRIPSEQISLIEEPKAAASVAEAVQDVIKIMDLRQEQLARNLGEGHRIIHGVAGSGKTLILGYRCERLASVLAKPILVLCYNITLAAKLEDSIRAKKLSEKVHVRNFHAWCRDQLKFYGVGLPPNGDNFHDLVVEYVIGAVDKGQVPKAQYGAVLIDEGHDFRPEWLKLVAQMVDPATSSLLLLYDDAQSIYDSKTKRKFNFSSLGIQAQGRTTILRVNYRNTSEVLSVAYEFAKAFIAPTDAEEDDVPLVLPQTGGRRGPMPVLNKLPSLAKEGEFIAKELLALKSAGYPWRDMAVLYRAKFIGEEIVRELRAASVPVEWVGEGGARRNFNPSQENVKVMTIHKSKGLEFPVVAIAGLGHMPIGNVDPKEEAKLLYVGMTRAMEMLLMTTHRETDFTVRLKSAQSFTATNQGRPPARL